MAFLCTIVMKRHIAIMQGINFVGIMKVKVAFCMGKLHVKWLKTGAFPRHIPVLLTIGNAPQLPGVQVQICLLAQ